MTLYLRYQNAVYRLADAAPTVVEALRKFNAWAEDQVEFLWATSESGKSVMTPDSFYFPARWLTEIESYLVPTGRELDAQGFKIKAQSALQKVFLDLDHNASVLYMSDGGHSRFLLPDPMNRRTKLQITDYAGASGGSSDRVRERWHTLLAALG